MSRTCQIDKNNRLRRKNGRFVKLLVTDCEAPIRVTDGILYIREPGRKPKRCLTRVWGEFA